MENIFIINTTLESRDPFHKQLVSIKMGYCKKDVTPLLTHWSYIFLALTHRYDLYLEKILLYYISIMIVLILSGHKFAHCHDGPAQFVIWIYQGKNEVWGLIDNRVLVQVMTWSGTGDKPLPETMMFSTAWYWIQPCMNIDNTCTLS